MNTSLRILMLEDNSTDVRVIRKVLSANDIKADFTIAQNGKEYLRALETETFDLILSDHQLPDYDSIQALQARNRIQPAVPLILITGAISEEMAIAIIKEGADDYILKDRLQRLPVAVNLVLSKKNIVDEKKTVEKALSELTERFQLAANTSFDIIWDYDLVNNSIYCSKALEKIMGIPYETFPPEYLYNFIHPEDLLGVRKSFIKMIRGHEHRWRKIFRVIRKDGSIGWMNSNALVIRNKDERASRVVGVMHDVTEVRRLQHELIEQELKSQKQITEITIEAQEKERLEIGKELHDNVNQLLATAKIMIDTAKHSPSIHDLCLEKSQESIIMAIDELRNLAHSMMTPPFEKYGFDTVIKDLVFKVNLTGKVNLEYSLPSEEVQKSMQVNMQLTFYRIIQEQVSNILKYSKADNASITLQADEDNFTLVIEDDGVGFDMQNKPRGIGLKNIESRAKLLNGTTTIVSYPGAGCIVRIQVPINNSMVDNDQTLVSREA